MKRALAAGGIGLGISIGALVAVLLGRAILALYFTFPGLWLTFIAVGTTGVNVGWNPVLARVFTTIANTAIYGGVCYLVMEFNGWLRP
jgi:hypothetical protein